MLMLRTLSTMPLLTSLWISMSNVLKVAHIFVAVGNVADASKHTHMTTIQDPVTSLTNTIEWTGEKFAAAQDSIASQLFTHLGSSYAYTDMMHDVTIALLKLKLEVFEAQIALAKKCTDESRQA